jgi:hypothetical protein
MGMGMGFCCCGNNCPIGTQYYCNDFDHLPDSDNGFVDAGRVRYGRAVYDFEQFLPRRMLTHNWDKPISYTLTGEEYQAPLEGGGFSIKRTAATIEIGYTETYYPGGFSSIFIGVSNRFAEQKTFILATTYEPYTTETIVVDESLPAVVTYRIDIEPTIIDTNDDGSLSVEVIVKVYTNGNLIWTSPTYSILSTSVCSYAVVLAGSEGWTTSYSAQVGTVQTSYLDTLSYFHWQTKTYWTERYFNIGNAYVVDGSEGSGDFLTKNNVNGCAPFTYSLADGSLPSGLTRDPETGSFVGIVNGPDGEQGFYVLRATSSDGIVTDGLKISWTTVGVPSLDYVADAANVTPDWHWNSTSVTTMIPVTSGLIAPLSYMYKFSYGNPDGDVDLLPDGTVTGRAASVDFGQFTGTTTIVVTDKFNRRAEIRRDWLVDTDNLFPWEPNYPPHNPDVITIERPPWGDFDYDCLWVFRESDGFLSFAPTTILPQAGRTYAIEHYRNFGWRLPDAFSIDPNTGVISGDTGNMAAEGHDWSSDNRIGSVRIRASDVAGDDYTTGYILYYYAPSVRELTYPDPYTNTGNGPSGGVNWRLDTSLPGSLSATATGIVTTTNALFEVDSGTLPPGYSIDSTTGDISGSAPFVPGPTSGTVVLRYTDDVGVVLSASYDWEAELFP